ncbi:MAG: MFS transporter [Chloroflexi bacterium]|nr:MFS transporter [Chloroflexota bacterium]
MRTTYSLALPVYVPTLLLSIGQGILLPTLPLYAQEFGVGFGLVSLAVAAAGLGTLIGDVPSGVLLERYGRKPVMVVGTISLALATLALAMLQFFPVLVALRLLAGIGTSMWNISRMAYLTDVVPPRDRGRALSTFGGVSRIGTFVGPALGGVIGSAFGLATPFYVAAGMAAAAAVISMVFIQESRHGEAVAANKMRWAIVGTLVRHHWRELGTAGSAQIFAQMIRAGRQIIVPLYGNNALGLDVAQIGTIVSISSAVDMSLFLPAGILMDKLGRKFASVPSFLVLALGMGLIPLATDYVGLLLATCVMGFGNGIGSGTMMTLGADLAPKKATGEFLGVWRLIGDVGATGGPLVVGGVADLVGLSLAAFSLTGVGVLAAATLLLFVRETLAEPQVAVTGAAGAAAGGAHEARAPANVAG